MNRVENDEKNKKYLNGSRIDCVCHDDLRYGGFASGVTMNNDDVTLKNKKLVRNLAFVAVVMFGFVYDFGKYLVFPTTLFGISRYATSYS